MKRFLLSLLLLNFPFLFFSMPGFDSYIPDSSGEYVYYKDYSFKRESYIGLLCYDNSTYQIRYFAPEDKSNYLPSKEIAILLTVNPEANYWEMTGENILTTILPNTDDADIVNYLHDILYEFSARRIKMGKLLPDTPDYTFNKSFKDNGLKAEQDFPQFGGRVTIIFDNMIPLFNIKNIIGINGKPVLECCTTGQLKSSADKSFENFSGFNFAQKVQNKAKQSQNSKKAKAQTVKFNGKKIVLDTDWQQPMENFWTLGNDSMITIGAIPFYSDDYFRNYTYIIRKLIQSSNGAYTDLTSMEISFDSKKDLYKLTAISAQPEINKNVVNVKILSEGPVPSETEGFIKEGKQINYFSISTYENAYLENEAYFDRIVRSYK